MKYAMIGTWKMAFHGIEEGSKLLKEKGNVSDAVIKAITLVEDEPDFISVGYGGLPNRDGELEMDAGFMDGDSLKIGAIISVKNIKNPIKVAHKLTKLSRNNILASRGAEMYAQNNGFEFKNMLTEKSKERYLEKLAEGFSEDDIDAYKGHDTVCVIGLDENGSMATGVSTSGLFMKHPGRVGDSPVVGSGYYCDSEIGGAAATGVGEEIMRGCLSLQIVNHMKNGMHPQEACVKTMLDHMNSLERRGFIPGSMSVIAMDKEGNFGAATSECDFPFIVSGENMETKIMVIQIKDKKITVMEVDEAWLREYKGD